MNIRDPEKHCIPTVVMATFGFNKLFVVKIVILCELNL